MERPNADQIQPTLEITLKIQSSKKNASHSH